MEGYEPDTAIVERRRNWETADFPLTQKTILGITPSPIMRTALFLEGNHEKQVLVDRIGLTIFVRMR